MAATTRWTWVRALIRATLIGTVLQLALAVMGHYDARIAGLFAAMGMFLSLVAGFLFGRLAGEVRRVGATLGGLAAGAVCALLGILESFSLGDVPVWVIAFGPVSSAVTGALGGFLATLTLKGRTEKAEQRRNTVA
jgi:MFS family permease